MTAGAALRPRAARLAALGLLTLGLVSTFGTLGSWQLERRAWKLELIAQVAARVHASPVPPPGRDAWAGVTAERDAYRRVRLDGAFEPGRETFVQAATELGSGYWVLAPFRTREGFVVLVNRGFVPPDRRDAPTLAGSDAVTGLLRITEPHGAFLRDNEPDADRWRSRDVAAIAAKRGLHDIAPYFVDADATPNPGGWPVGGLTVTTFRNAHLVYALTWFGLAAMTLGGGAIVARHEVRER